MSKNEQRRLIQQVMQLSANALMTATRGASTRQLVFEQIIEDAQRLIRQEQSQ